MLIAYTYNLQTKESIDQAEFDSKETVNFITKTIEELNHKVVKINANISVYDLIKKIEKVKPDLIFNTAEGVKGTFREAFYPALYDLLKIPFTGSDAYTNTITLDKSLTKLLLKGYRIKTPNWEFVDRLEDVKNIKLKYPLIVKPNYEGSSKGIDVDSIVLKKADLINKVVKKLSEFKEGLIIEEYIDGVDIAVPYVNIEGNNILPAIKYLYKSRRINNHSFKIYDYDLKHFSSDKVNTILLKTNINVKKRLENYSVKLRKLFKIKDFARFDFRLSTDGEVYFIEANALPSLQEDSGMFISAKSAGVDKKEYIKHIIESASKRFGIL